MALPYRRFTDEAAILQAAATLAAAQYSAAVAVAVAQGQYSDSSLVNAVPFLADVLREMAEANLIPPDLAPPLPRKS